jgi:hypothetical protein
MEQETKEREPDPMRPQVNYNKVVDEDEIVIGKNTPKMSQTETLKMFEERLDTLPRNSDERKIYEKAWNGTKKYFN